MGTSKKGDFNSGADDARAIRQEMVAHLRARKLTMTEIVRALAAMDPPIICSEMTVHGDIARLRQQWAARAEMASKDWVAEELADLEELEAAAWKQKKLDTVLRIKERKAKLLGLDKIQATKALNIDMANLTDDQLKRIAAGEDILDVLASSASIS
jgi:hypothetical protein